MQDTSDKDNYRILKYTILDCITSDNIADVADRPPDGPSEHGDCAWCRSAADRRTKSLPAVGKSGEQFRADLREFHVSPGFMQYEPASDRQIGPAGNNWPKSHRQPWAKSQYSFRAWL
jgi:hypothetical protein